MHLPLTCTTSTPQTEWGLEESFIIKDLNRFTFRPRFEAVPSLAATHVADAAAYCTGSGSANHAEANVR